MDENEELNKLMTELFTAWCADVESEPIPVLVSDEDAVKIIMAAVGRPGVARRIINWMMNR